MRDILAYVQEDLSGHIARSGAPLRSHADPNNSRTPAEREEYFSGMTTLFPLMFLGHYYEWLELPNRKDYQNEFLPWAESFFAPTNRALLHEIFQKPVSDSVWLSMLSGYLAYYPYALLEAFGRWALPDERMGRLSVFLQTDRAEALPALLKRLSAASVSPTARTEAVYWLGTEYPYELLPRFHRSLFEH